MNVLFLYFHHSSPTIVEYGKGTWIRPQIHLSIMFWAEYPPPICNLFVFSLYYFTARFTRQLKASSSSLWLSLKQNSSTYRCMYLTETLWNMPYTPRFSTAQKLSTPFVCMPSPREYATVWSILSRTKLPSFSLSRMSYLENWSVITVVFGLHTFLSTAKSCFPLNRLPSLL